MPTSFTFGYVGASGRDSAPYLVRNGATEIKTAAGTTSPTTSTAPSHDTLGRQPVCRVATTVDVYVSFGTAPNATSDGSRVLLPAGGVEYFGVEPGFKGDAVTV